MGRVLLLAGAIALLVLAARGWRDSHAPAVPPVAISALPAPPELEPIIPAVPLDAAPRVFDISVHTEAELELLFDRVEQLLDRPHGENEAPLVSLVLHGPEVAFFALGNYRRYKPLVDRAAKLAAFGAVDISICRTRMDSMGIGPEEVPAFLIQVPYGPDEIKTLINKGYYRM